MSLLHPLRRGLNRFTGHGPWQLAPFDAIIATKHHSPQRRAVDTEFFDGIVHHVAPDAFDFPSIDFSLGARYRRGGLAPEPRRELWLLSPGAVAGTSGLVHEPTTRTAVLETMLDWQHPPARHPLLAAPGFPAATTLPGLSLSLVTLSAEGFWHFLIEALPKLHLAAAWLPRIDHFLVNGPASPWKTRWLVHAGVPAGRIVWIEGLSHVSCEQLLFTPPLVADCLPTPWTVASLRHLLNVPPATKPTRRIWAARSDAATRCPMWQRDLISALPGWESIEFSRLSPSETIALCGETAVLAGPHGANLANAVFLPPGASLLEVAPPGLAKPLFHRLAAAGGLRFSHHTADFSAPDALPGVIAALSAPARA